MAVVRITKELRGIILGIATKKFEPMVSAAMNSKPEDKFGDYIYDQVWGLYRERMEALPNEFFRRRSTIAIRQVANVPLTFITTFSQERPVPGVPDAKSHMIRDNGSSYTLVDDPVWAPIIEEARAWQERCSVAGQRRQNFVNGVTAVLDSFTTLAPALKEWPPLWELVPEHVKTQHKEIKERTKTYKPGVDKQQLGAMTGALTAIKLGGM